MTEFLPVWKCNVMFGIDAFCFFCVCASCTTALKLSNVHACLSLLSYLLCLFSFLDKIDIVQQNDYTPTDQVGTFHFEPFQDRLFLKLLSVICDKTVELTKIFIWI